MNARDAYLHMLAAHEGAVDKSGEPYLFHPLAVEEGARPFGEDYSVVALVHDVREDAPWYGLPGPADDGGPNGALTARQDAALDAITRRKDERYSAYLVRVKADFVARVVKILDFRHNLSPERMAELPAEEAASLAKRYEAGLRFLEAAD